MRFGFAQVLPFPDRSKIGETKITGFLQIGLICPTVYPDWSKIGPMLTTDSTYKFALEYILMLFKCIFIIYYFF